MSSATAIPHCPRQWKSSSNWTLTRHWKPPSPSQPHVGSVVSHWIPSILSQQLWTLWTASAQSQRSRKPKMQTTMGEACYTARATTKQQVLDRNETLTLQTNKNRQRTHDAILLLQRAFSTSSKANSTPATQANLTTSKTFTKKINSIYKSTILYLRNIKLVLIVCFYKFEIE